MSTMSIDGFYDLMANDSGVMAKVANGPDGGPGIYPGIAPADANRPYVVYAVRRRESSEVSSGASGLAKTEIRATCWADTHRESHVLSESVRNATQGYRGTRAGIQIGNITIGRLQDVIDVPRDLPPRYGVQMDIGIWHTENVPTPA